jgi:hypothetical protein
LNNQAEDNEMGWACSTNGEKNAYSLLMEKLDGKKLLGEPRCRWVDNIKIDLGGI